MIWLGLAFLSASWLFAFGYYHAVDRVAWGAMVALGVVSLLGGPVRPRMHPTPSVAALLLSIPSLLLLPQPYFTGVALLIVGLLLHLITSASGVARWQSLLARISGATLPAGVLLLTQGVAIRCYAGFTARSHELFSPLPQWIGFIARTLGIDSAQYEQTVSMHSMRRIHQLSTTWERFLEPVTFCFLVGVLAVFVWFRWEARWSWRQLVVGLSALVLGMLIWLPLRSGLMMALYLHDVLRTDYGAPLDGPELYWDNWLHLFMLAGPVAICWRFLPRTDSAETFSDSESTATSETNRQAWVALTLFAAAVGLITMGAFWHPVGQRQAGRVLVDEYHPDPDKVWEPSTKPFDTTWYGTDAGYNYYCIYDYLSHFYNMSRSDAPLDASVLDRFDVLVVKVPTRAYSATEIAAMRDFVHSGGGLLLIGEHTNVFHTSDYLNPIARTFGFEFREDCLFGIDSVFEQQYEPPLVPHPIVQHIDRMNFATSCSIDPGWSRGDAVILDTGLKNLLADYHSDNFYPLPEDRAEMQYGTFVQSWVTQHGAGRVVAFTDSTIFSNFCVFDEGKSELMLGMVEWLNHRDSRIPYRMLMAVAGVLIAASAFVLTRHRKTHVVLLFAAALLGSSIGITSNSRFNRMPFPQRMRDFVQVNIDRSVSDVPLSRNGFVDGTDQGFGIFERWMLRLGYFTSRRGDDDLWNGDLVVVLRPRLAVDRSYCDRMEKYVREGGNVLVVDSAGMGSTTNTLLKPFGLSINTASAVSGMLQTEQDWSCVPVSNVATTTGGQPFAWVDEQPVGTVMRHGDGSVTVIGIADRFCDAEMGRSGDVIPDEPLQQLYELQFALVRRIVEGAEED